MIKITNGTTNKVVTVGAYKEFYECLGYEVVDANNKKREVENKKEEVKEKVIIKDDEDKGEKKSQKVENFKKR